MTISTCTIGYLEPSMVVCWQGQDQDLYDISLKQLGLSDDMYEIMPEYYRTVGHCIDYFVTILNRYPKSRLGIEGLYGPADASRSYPYPMSPMFDEVQPRLMELGYWQFVEDHVY